MKHKHCVFCGDESSIPSPTSLRDICTSPANTLAPDPLGNRHHAYLVNPTTDQELTVVELGKLPNKRAKGEWEPPWTDEQLKVLLAECVKYDLTKPRPAIWLEGMLELIHAHSSALLVPADGSAFPVALSTSDGAEKK